MSAPSIDDVQAAAALVAGHVVRTPLVPAPALSQALGCQIYLKLETLQVTGAFKERGALVKLNSLPSDVRRRGVIAMSAGNHAQGLAYHATRLGIPATIVMPENTPNSKVDRTQGVGGRVVLLGETVDSAAEAARDLAALEDLTFVHPFDDSLIIAGQGTIGLEMLNDQPDLDCIIVPIGGGGLVSGIAIAAKHIRPEIEIHGVEPSLYPCMAAALGRVPEGVEGSTIADGLAVTHAGALTCSIVDAYVDDIVSVDETMLESAIFLLIEQLKVVAEGAGAASLAALLRTPDRYRGRKVGLVISGGNIDVRVLSSVLTRGMAREGRLLSLCIQADDKPGSLADMTRIVGDLGANILEIFHHRSFYDVPVRRMDIELVVETRNRDHADSLIKVLAGHGFEPRILSGRSSGETAHHNLG